MGKVIDLNNDGLECYTHSAVNWIEYKIIRNEYLCKLLERKKELSEIMILINYEENKVVNHKIKLFSIL